MVAGVCRCLLPARARHRQSEEGAQRPWVWGLGHGEHVSSHELVTSPLREPCVTSGAGGVQTANASRKQSSLSGKESAQGCIPKRLPGRPDEALGGGKHPRGTPRVPAPLPLSPFSPRVATREESGVFSFP